MPTPLSGWPLHTVGVSGGSQVELATPALYTAPPHGYFVSGSQQGCDLVLWGRPTKYHKPGALNNKVTASQFWRLEA